MNSEKSKVSAWGQTNSLYIFAFKDFILIYGYTAEDLFVSIHNV